MPRTYQPDLAVGRECRDRGVKATVIEIQPESAAAEEEAVLLLGASPALGEQGLLPAHRIDSHPGFECQRRVCRSIPKGQAVRVGHGRIVIDAVQVDEMWATELCQHRLPQCTRQQACHNDYPRDLRSNRPCHPYLSYSSVSVSIRHDWRA